MEIILAILKEALCRGLKLFTPKDFLGKGNAEELWITDLKVEDGKVKIEIEAPKTELLLWLAANARLCSEECLSLQDFADTLVLDKYPDWKPEAE